MKMSGEEEGGSGPSFFQSYEGGRRRGREHSERERERENEALLKWQ